jgi:ligand-binding sensor domain-containing protein/tRNA A-37 threonylcarbamoyl transferase component Bud32
MTEPKRIGKYEIIEEIGRGGFAVVYRARDTKLNRVIALKVLHPQLTTDPKFVQRFRQEARAAAGLRHPHIVTIHDVGEEAGQHYLAMAFLPGRTLDKRLAEGPLPVEQAVSIAKQMAWALDAIHGQDLVHRDVKPGNIMVDDAGQATLLDFGIVRAAEGTRVTTTMAVLGTAEYMAPEQAELEEGKEIDWRADIYALGVVAYEMLVGRPPFTGKSPTAILHKHVYEAPPAPSELNPDLPAGLEPVLLQALAKKREERFQQAGAFAAALRQVLTTESQARQRETQLAQLYQQLQAAGGREDWAEVVALGGQILALTPSYQDVAQRMAHARERLRQPPRAPARPQPRERTPKPEHAARRTRPWLWGTTVTGLLILVSLCVCMALGPLRGIIFPPTEGPAKMPTATLRPSVETIPPPTKAPTAKPPPPTETIPPPTKTSLEVLPTPVTERTTAAGTWSAFTNSDYVNALAFHNDLLWVGTSGGLVAWDPERGSFAKYTTLDGLAGNTVQAIVVGPDGALWLSTGSWGLFGTVGNGVSRYDPAAGTWQTFTTAEGLAGDTVSAIAVGPDGALWFGTDSSALFGNGNGASRYDPAAGTWQTFTSADGLAGNTVHAIAVGPDGALWFSAYTRGLFGTSGGVSRYDPAAGIWQTFTTADGLAGNVVQAIAVGLDGALWFGTYGDGVSRYDPTAGTWQTFTTADGLTDSSVRAIAVGPDGDLWFSTDSGISQYDPAADTWQTFTTADGLAGNVQAIAVGPDGDLWFSTDSGISQYDPAADTWQTFTTADGLAGSGVLAVAVGPDGALWFGTVGNGVSRYDPAAGIWQTLTTADGLAGNVQAIAVGPDGDLWFGTGFFGQSGNGVSRYDPSAGTWQTFASADGLADNAVQAIAAGPDGDLWFGTGGGVSRYDPAAGTWQTFTSADGLADNSVYAIAVGPDGALWFGTGGGVSQYDPAAGTWQTFTSADGLADNTVSAISVGPDGALWFGTGDGVSRYDPAAGTWQTFTSADGLADSSVFAIAVGPAGALWFGTGGGVSCYDPAAGTWQTFTSADGLADNTVSAIAVGPDGALWFGTWGGVSRFEPARP